MADAISDITNLANAFSGFAQSVTQLHEVRVQAETTKRALDRGSAWFNYLQRINLPMDDPNKLSLDEGSPNYWRPALEQLEQETEGYLSSIKDPRIREGVRGKLQAQDQQFILDLSSSLATAEKTLAQENYMVALQRAGDMNNDPESVRLYDEIVKYGIFSPEETEVVRRSVMVPIAVKGYVAKAMAPVIDTDGKEIYPTFSESKSEISNMDIASDEERLMSIQAIDKAQLQFETRVGEEFKIIKESDAADGVFSPKRVTDLLEKDGRNMTQTTRESIVDYYKKESIQVDSSNIEIWTTDLLTRYGRGISWASADGMKKTLATRMEAVYGPQEGWVGGVDAEGKVIEGKMPAQVHKTFNKSINDIDLWKQSGSGSGDVILDGIKLEWLKVREVGLNSEGGTGLQLNGFLARQNWILRETLKHGNEPGVIDWGTKLLQSERDQFKEDMKDSTSGASKEVAMLRMIVAGDVFKQDLKSGTVADFKNFVKKMNDPDSWNDKDSKMSSIWVDAMDRTDAWAKQGSRTEVEVRQHLSGELSALLEFEKQALATGKDRWTSSALQSYAGSYAAMEESSIDLAATGSYSESQKGLVTAAQKQLIEPLVSAGVLGSGDSVGERLASIQLVKSGKRPNDLYYVNTKTKTLYTVDSIGGELVFRKALGSYDGGDPANYRGTWGSKDGDGATMWALKKLPAPAKGPKTVIPEGTASATYPYVPKFLEYTKESFDRLSETQKIVLYLDYKIKPIKLPSTAQARAEAMGDTTMDSNE